MASVDILLATYNGAAHVQEQIASLQRQTFADWRLLVRDDGSRDATPELIDALAVADARILVVRDTLGNLGFNGNFHALLRQSRAPWVMFCDQDDVWLPNKIERTLAVMRQQPAESPVLVHCDAVVSDANLQPLRPRFIGDRGRAHGLTSVLLANPVQGAAMMINAPLRTLMLQHVPRIPFDCQAALLAEATGQRVFIPEALLLYRQHGSNALGAAGARAEPVPDETIPPRRRAGLMLTMGLKMVPHARETLESARAQWHVETESLLARHEQFAQPGGSWAKLWWWWRGGYQYFRRRDRLDALLWAVGWYRALAM